MSRLHSERFTPLRFPQRNRSGIATVRTLVDPLRLVELAERQGLIITAPGSYLRLAPHFYLTEEDMVKAAAILNSIA